MTLRRGAYVLGIDVGTSYVKGALLTRDGALEATTRMRSPVAAALVRNSLDPVHCWRVTLLALRRLLTGRPAIHNVEVCISAVAPALIAFDEREPDTAIGLPYWPLHELDGELKGIDRAKNRASHLRSQLGTQRTTILDLCGYIVFRLTNLLSINTTIASELGVETLEDLGSLVGSVGTAAVKLGAPAEIVGPITRPIREHLSVPRFCEVTVTSGTSDTLASLYGATMGEADARCIYLGTFGSLAHLKRPIDVTYGGLQPAPYTWLVSVPGYGAKVEEVATSLRGGMVGPTGPAALDSLALRAPAGCDGSFYELPRWTAIGQPVGRYQFHSHSGDRHPSIVARAILEGIAVLIAVSEPTVLREASIAVAGGGSGSRAWLGILCDMLQTTVVTYDLSATGAGTALIALRASETATHVDHVREASTKQHLPTRQVESLVRSTRDRAFSVYHAEWARNGNIDWIEASRTSRGG
jgi:sugar (pentulose or hexulose) kinase